MDRGGRIGWIISTRLGSVAIAIAGVAKEFATQPGRSLSIRSAAYVRVESLSPSALLEVVAAAEALAHAAALPISCHGSLAGNLDTQCVRCDF